MLFARISRGFFFWWGIRLVGHLSPEVMHHRSPPVVRLAHWVGYVLVGIGKQSKT